MPQKIALEHGGDNLWYGRIVGLIGTHARGRSREEVISRLEKEVSYHVKWLEGHGESTPTINEIELAVTDVESNVAELGESGGEVAFYDFDRQRVSNDLLERCIRCMRYNRVDLLELVRDLPLDVMEKTPPAKSRNIQGILAHICNAEEFYIARLGEETDRIYEGYLGMPESQADSLPILERMELVRGASIETLRFLVLSKNGMILTRPDYTRYPNEKWSTYKIIRRFLEHEREHIYNIRGYLSLLLRE